MKYSVTDADVNRWADLIRAGLPTNEVFPSKMSDCEFTDAQKEVIRAVRADRKARIKALKIANGSLKKEVSLPAPAAHPAEAKFRAANKLQKMLYMQHGKCFFCGEALAESDASIEHLQPLSRGGTRTEDNEVVCHRSLNATFGQLDLKRKTEFILRSAGQFRCPKG